jgi:hypothetical protein
MSITMANIKAAILTAITIMEGPPVIQIEDTPEA